MELSLPLRTVGAAEIGGADTRIVDRDEAPVALVATRLCGAVEAEDRAAFIVRAVNAHDDLVAALKACVDRMGDDHPGSNAFWDAVRLGEAALAKVGAE